MHLPRAARPARLLAGSVSLVAAVAACAQTPLWLAGEWNNHEQVWQQRIDAAKPADAGAAQRPSEVPHRQAVVRAGSDGAWRVQWHEGVLHGRGAALLTQSWRVTLPEGGAGTALLNVEGSACSVVLARSEGPEAWAGASAPGQCTLAGQKRRVQARLSPGMIEWQEHAEGQNGPAPPLRLRKQRYFEGWVWFRNAGPGASPDDKDTSFTARISLHSEGQRLVLQGKDGTDSPWELEFALLTYQNTRRPILKFGLVDRSTGKSISYTWASTDASNIGFNLGWFQSGLTLRPEGQNLYGN